MILENYKKFLEASLKNTFYTCTSTLGSKPTFSLRSNPSENDAIILAVVQNGKEIRVPYRKHVKTGSGKREREPSHNHVNDEFHSSSIANVAKVKS